MNKKEYLKTLDKNCSYPNWKKVDYSTGEYPNLRKVRLDKDVDVMEVANTPYCKDEEKTK